MAARMSKRFSVEPGDKKPWKRMKRGRSEDRKHKEEERWKKERRVWPGSEETSDPRVNQGTWSSSCYRKENVGRSQNKKEKSWSKVKIYLGPRSAAFLKIRYFILRTNF